MNPVSFQLPRLADNQQYTPGFVEYLRTLLTTKYGTCPHTDDLLNFDKVTKSSSVFRRTKPSETFGIPQRLCLFSERTSATNELLADIYYIDTKNLCRACYEKAFPTGFNVWSTTYFDEYDKLHDNDPQHKQRRVRYPQMINAFSGQKAFPRQDSDVSWPRLPGATIAHECWRWLVWMHAPFYIDQLCIFPPYNSKLTPNSPEAKAEGDRIDRLNRPAYDGARYGIIGTPLGGAGLYSTIEQQLLGDRCVMIPPAFGNSRAIEELGWGYVSFPS